MKSGDERYFLARDKGPVRSFIRDFVDSRFSFIELMIPLLILTMVLGYSGNPTARQHGQHRSCSARCSSWSSTCSSCGAGCAASWPAASPTRRTKGTTYYAVMRSMQMKFMRLPKPKVKIGQQLPEHYR